MSAELAECIHGIYPESSCTVCNGRDRAERLEAQRQATTVAFYFTAQYGGECPRCGLPIAIHDQCAQMQDGTNIHRGCIE